MCRLTLSFTIFPRGAVSKKTLGGWGCMKNVWKINMKIILTSVRFCVRVPSDDQNIQVHLLQQVYVSTPSNPHQMRQRYRSIFCHVLHRVSGLRTVGLPYVWWSTARVQHIPGEALWCKFCSAHPSIRIWKCCLFLQHLSWLTFFQNVVYFSIQILKSRFSHENMSCY